MLNSLEIKNYRNLKHLCITKLGRVNLIVGKNNTGKSSLLEAVMILGASNPMNAIQSILEQRLENFTADDNKGEFLNESISTIISNIFYKKDIGIDIYVGDGVKKMYLTFNLSDEQHNYSSTLVVEKSNGERIITGLGMGLLRLFEIREPLNGKRKEETRHISTSIFQDLQKEAVHNWSTISLNQEKEKYVIKSLRILNSDIEQFNFVSVSNTDGKYFETKQQPRVRLSTGEITNLRSMGDGINRILTIILAMVNCENGYLLIDEFENGLHYSVQEKLWEIIFFLANKLNVQVFATTHSSDAIHTFENIANSRPEYQDAQLIKLRNIDGEIEVVLFDTEDLEVINDNPYIDPR